MTRALIKTIQTKYQMKALSANKTTDGVMSDLTFTLEIGKTYKINLHAQMRGTAADPGLVILIKDGTTSIGRLSTAIAVDGQALTQDTTVIRTMTNTSLTFETSSCTSLSYVGGDGTSFITAATVEELPCAVLNTSW